MNPEVFTFYVSTGDKPDSSPEISFTGTIVTIMKPSVVSESFAAKFPANTIDRDERPLITTTMGSIRSNGRIEIKFRVEHQQQTYRTGFLILSDSVVKPGKIVVFEDEVPTTDCDAIIGGKVAERIGLLDPARGGASLILSNDVTLQQSNAQKRFSLMRQLFSIAGVGAKQEGMERQKTQD